jgi:hypothetical protein
LWALKAVDFDRRQLATEAAGRRRLQASIEHGRDLGSGLLALCVSRHDGMGARLAPRGDGIGDFHKPHSKSRKTLRIWRATTDDDEHYVYAIAL